MSSEFLGEGVQPTIVDANKRLLGKNGKMLPESGDIRIALIGDSREVRDNICVNEINGFDFSISFSFGDFLDKDVFLSLLLIFEKGFFTLKENLIGYSFIDLNKSL